MIGTVHSLVQIYFFADIVWFDFAFLKLKSLQNSRLYAKIIIYIYNLRDL